MNAKDFLRLGVPLGEAARRTTNFVAKFILSGESYERIDDCVKHVTLRL